MQPILVGNGTAAMAADFRQQFEITLPLYTDPSRRAFAEAGMKSKFGIGLRSFGHLWRAWRAGYRQGGVQGAPFQQGGLLLVDRQGRERFRFVDEGAGEHLGPEEALARVEAALAI